MKKPIIKNWIKYFTGTLAVSGMLLVGGCDNNTNDQQDNTTETAENEVGQPTRDNVSQDVETDTYDNDEDAGQDGQEATGTQAQPQYDQMSNRSSAPRAQDINNMDNHLQQHSVENREITETLTERENLKDGESAGIHRGETTKDGQMPTDRNNYDRQSNTDFEDKGDDTMNRQQDMETGSQGATGTQEPTQQRNTLDNEQDANMGRQGTTTQQGQDTDMDQEGTTGITYDRQSNTDLDQTDNNMNRQSTQGIPEEGETYQGQDSEAEVGTDRQGTTQMTMDRNQQGNTPQRDENSPMEQQQGMGTDVNNNDVILGEEDDTNVNIRDRESTEEESDHLRETGANRSGATTNDQNTGMNQQGATQQQGDNQQMSQQENGTGVIIYERYSVTYPESYSDEDRRRTEDIMNEYETRRESMRGQMNEENGAYMAPEVDAEPREGYDQLMSQIQENLNYPQDAAAAEIEGTIFVNFVVDENGNIEEARAVEDVVVPSASLKSATNPLDPTKFHEQEIEEIKEEMRQAAVEAVEATSGQWTPGQQGGENVRSEVQIPVRFVMQDNRANTIQDR